MLKNYLKITIRNIKKNKAISAINLIGLAVGIICAALIFMWVNDEISYDSFNKNENEIYRVLVQRKGIESISAETPGLLAEAIKSEIPEVKYAARVIQNFRNPFRYDDKSFYEDETYCADPDLFKMFTFPIVKGDSKDPIKNPNDLVITQDLAKKYFGDENPIGKIMIWNNRRDYRISAVMKNMPPNSSLQIQLLESHSLTAKHWKGGYNWTNFVHETYIQVRKNSNVKLVEKKIEAILNHNCNISNRYFFIHLQPLSDMHLNADITNSFTITNDKIYITILSIIAFFILLIACINFINISSANSITRAKEVGIRKVIGAQRKKLIYQFMIEFIISAFVSAITALVLIEIILPYFNKFTGKSLSLGIHFYIFLLVTILFTVLFAGSYPAFYLSKISPAAVFKSKFIGNKKRVSLRSILVTLQFSISIVLIVCSLIVSSQLSYIQNKKLGFDKDNILYIPAKGALAEKYESVKNTLLQNSGINGVAMQQSVPITTIEGSWVHWQGQTRQDMVVRDTKVTPDYFSTMNIGLKEGRLFSKEIATDKDAAFILNEAAVDFLGFKSPIGMQIRTAGREGSIIGVVQNSHFKSLHDKIEPLIFMELNNYKSIDLFGVVLIRFSTKDMPALLANIKNTWQQYNPDLPFEYHFLNQTIEKQYSFEMKLRTIFSWFSFIAIVISILGLLGLAILLMEQHTKEIGIRKVLGASITEIITMLTKDFMKWILIANAIAWPIAYYFMNKWLQDFAYRINISWLIFVLAGGIALVTALATVSFQAIKAATANPVKSLKYE